MQNTCVICGRKVNTNTMKDVDAVYCPIIKAVVTIHKSHYEN